MDRIKVAKSKDNLAICTIFWPITVNNYIIFNFFSKQCTPPVANRDNVFQIFIIMSTPSEFLKDLIGNPVVVKLNSGVDYRGILNCLDGYMNIALEQTEEYVNGQLKKKYGDAFIRGNNVLYISKQKRRA